jgi:hypothetical protein
MKNQKSWLQRLNLSMGLLLLLLTIVGVLRSDFMGLHLSLLHNTIHLMTGLVALWGGLANSKRGFYVGVGLGAFYAMMGLMGMFLGSPGYPSVGAQQGDQNLFKVLPNLLELGTIDHLFHLLFSAVFLFTVLMHRKERFESQKLLPGQG